MAGDTGGDLAEYVRTRRLRAGLTQEALAERAGLSVDNVGALERGLRRRLYPHTARALADALDLSAAERAALTDLARGPRRAPAAPAGTTAPDLVASSIASAPGPTPIGAAPDTIHAPHNLPAPLTRLIGRERELAQIQDRLAHTRLLTLTGTGGIGKTRLAVEAAHALRPRYADGVWLVELAPLTDPALVLGAVATVLGVREAPGQPLRATLAAALHARHLLLVLDNCEQVLDVASDIAALLGACPTLAVLATSRAPLRLSGEHELLVPSLPVPTGPLHEAVEAVAQYAAVRLFVERAAAVKADFALTPANVPTVAAICARLDGLPLALELAAARVKLFPPQALLTRLDQRLPFLTGGSRDRPARQRTLRAAVAWSYDLLTGPEQALFRRLSVFVGGFTLAAAEVVCTDAADLSLELIDTLGALVDRSLLQRDDAAAEALARDEDEDDDGTSLQRSQPEDQELRFTMLETIREYALEQLAAEGGAERWQGRQLAYYLGLMERAEQDLQETAPMATVWRTRRRLAPEHGNLRAALTWAITHARSEDALRLAASLCALWVPAGNLRVARRWLEQPGGTLREARRWLDQALALDAPASAAARARALHGLGRVLLFQWDDPNAERDEAIRAFEQSLVLYRRLDDRHGTARCLLDLGWALFDQDDVTRAAEAFEESLALCRAVDDPIGVGWSLIGLGRIAQPQGDEHAAMLIEDGLAQQRRAGNPLGVAAALDSLGLVRQAQGHSAQAKQCFEEAVALRRVVGAQSGLPIALQRLAVLLGAGGDTRGAAALMRESLLLSQRMSNPWDTANGLLIVGALAAGMGLPESGARLFGAGEALIAVKGLVMPEAYRGLYTRAVAGVRRALGEEAFAATWAAGQALSGDAAITEALEVTALAEHGAPSG